MVASCLAGVLGRHIHSVAGGVFFVARTLLAPIAAAAIISIMFSPLATYATRYRIPASLFALTCIGSGAPRHQCCADDVGRGACRLERKRRRNSRPRLRAKAHLFERPLAVWHELQLWPAKSAGHIDRADQIELPVKDVIGSDCSVSDTGAWRTGDIFRQPLLLFVVEE